jgi:hypothetical protein
VWVATSFGGIGVRWVPTTSDTTMFAQKFNSPSDLALHAVWATSTDCALVFDGTNSAYTSSWVGTTGYIGFQIPPGGGGGYFWVYISVNAAADEIALLDWGVLSAASGGNTGGGSPAAGTHGTTPEPAAAGLSLLAVGAAGVMRHKRRKQTAV